MTFRVAGLDEIKRWVLSLGAEGAVLEPQTLRDSIRNDLNRTLEQYRTPRMPKLSYVASNAP